MKHLKLLAILLCMALPAYGMSPMKELGKVKSYDITFPGNFYTDEIRSCKAVQPVAFESSISIIKGDIIEDRIVKYNGKEYIVKGYTQKDQTIINDTVKIIEGLIGYDWHADHSANSNSMDVHHQAITVPMNLLMAATHNALSKNIKSEIDTAKNLLIDLAKTDTLYDSIGYYKVQKKPGCYANGDPNSPCWYHEYQYARNVFARYMVNALWLKDELNEQEFKIVNKYIEKMYKKFIEPVELEKQEQGFYQMANGGMAILAYASWTNDKELAAEEITHRFKEIDSLFYEDGYINDNSFRGYKGQWYHSLGLDSALGYIYIAKLWGAEVPTKLQNKLVKASEVVNLAITDWDKFKSRQHNKFVPNAILDPKNAMKYTHQYAIAIDTLMLEVTNVELEYDTTYLQKRNYQIEMSYGIDELIGFPAGCIQND